MQTLKSRNVFPPLNLSLKNVSRKYMQNIKKFAFILSYICLKYSEWNISRYMVLIIFVVIFVQSKLKQKIVWPTTALLKGFPEEMLWQDNASLHIFCETSFANLLITVTWNESKKYSWTIVLSVYYKCLLWCCLCAPRFSRQ